MPVTIRRHGDPGISGGEGGGEGPGGGGEGAGGGGDGDGGGGKGDGHGKLDHTMMLLYEHPSPLQLWSHSTRPRSQHRRTASWYVVYSNDESHTPAMQPFASFVPTYRRHSPPVVQHCAAIA